MFYKSIAPANHTDNQTAKIKNIFLIIHTKSSHAMKMFLMTQTVSVSLKQFFPIGYYLTTKRHNNYSKSNPAINFKHLLLLPKPYPCHTPKG